MLHRRAVVHTAGVMAPRFEVDPTRPKPLPNHWLMGETIGVSATATIISGSSSARVRSNQASSARRRVLPMRSAALWAYKYGIGPKAVKMNTLRWWSCVDEIALRDRAFWVPAGSPPGRRGLYALSGPAARRLSAGPGSGTRRRTAVAAGSQAA